MPWSVENEHDLGVNLDESDGTPRPRQRNRGQKRSSSSSGSMRRSSSSSRHNRTRQSNGSGSGSGNDGVEEGQSNSSSKGRSQSKQRRRRQRPQKRQEPQTTRALTSSSSRPPLPLLSSPGGTGSSSSRMPRDAIQTIGSFLAILGPYVTDEELFGLSPDKDIKEIPGVKETCEVVMRHYAMLALCKTASLGSIEENQAQGAALELDSSGDAVMTDANHDKDNQSTNPSHDSSCTEQNDQSTSNDNHAENTSQSSPQSITSNTTNTTTNHHFRMETETVRHYLSAWKEFRESQMDRQLASLRTNTIRETRVNSEEIIGNHRRALGEVLAHAFPEEVSGGGWKELGKDDLCSWHETMIGATTTRTTLSNTMLRKPMAGKYRETTARAGVTCFCPAKDVPNEMNHFLQSVQLLQTRWFGDTSTQRTQDDSPSSVLCAVALASLVTFGIVDVHPFSDGNGRLGRMGLNWAMRRTVQLPFVVNMCATAEQRKEYIVAIQKTRENMLQLVRRFEGEAFSLVLENRGNASSLGLSARERDSTSDGIRSDAILMGRRRKKTSKKSRSGTKSDLDKVQEMDKDDNKTSNRNTTMTPDLKQGAVFAPLIHLILQRLRCAALEFNRHLSRKAAAVADVEEARAARRARERASSTTCIICLDDTTPSNVSALCCGQPAHLNCMAEWLSANPTCPFCRGAMPLLPPFRRRAESEDDDDDDDDEDDEEDDSLFGHSTDTTHTTTTTDTTTTAEGGAMDTNQMESLAALARAMLRRNYGVNHTSDDDDDEYSPGEATDDSDSDGSSLMFRRRQPLRITMDETDDSSDEDNDVVSIALDSQTSTSDEDDEDEGEDIGTSSYLFPSPPYDPYPVSFVNEVSMSASESPSSPYGPLHHRAFSRVAASTYTSPSPSVSPSPSASPSPSPTSRSSSPPPSPSRWSPIPSPPSSATLPIPRRTQPTPLLPSVTRLRCNFCSNSAALDCVNRLCGRCCVIRGEDGCFRHNTQHLRG